MDELFADQIRSEVLFDSYHAVCMGRSKEIGPRVIALLTAQIVLRDGVATDEEESMFAAAEEFSDNEFLMFREYLRKSLTAAEGPEGGDSSINDHGEVVCRIRVTDVDSRWSLGSVPMSGQNLGSWLGSWAARLSTNGLLDDIVEQESFPYKEDSERHIDEDGVVTRFTWSAVFSPAAVIFLALIERVCSGSAPESAGDGR
ncbi:hypothetical protein [Arenimonas sp.]|uniref:hypothetical protein n=1 Tax=Arenimonas sp. TaxID=1872635 RepID=UPI0025F101FB|nr:hypothetical protein [Arenimonas sp.]